MSNVQVQLFPVSIIIWNIVLLVRLFLICISLTSLSTTRYKWDRLTANEANIIDSKDVNAWSLSSWVNLCVNATDTKCTPVTPSSPVLTVT